MFHVKPYRRGQRTTLVVLEYVGLFPPSLKLYIHTQPDPKTFKNLLIYLRHQRNYILGTGPTRIHNIVRVLWSKLNFSNGQSFQTCLFDKTTRLSLYGI